MPLADVLSAVRQLILDESALPSDAGERRAWLAQRFAAMSARELDDLAAIPPERIAVYTDTIFAGERALLRWAYPMTLAALHFLADDSIDARSGPQRLDDFELVRDMHRHRPWRTASSRELAASFQAYIHEHHAGLVRAWPGLSDLIDYERTDLEVFYAADAGYRAVTSDELSAWPRMSVGEVLALPVLMPAYAAVRRYGHDVLAMADRWREAKILPSALPAPASCLAVCGRRWETLMPQWLRLTQRAHAALSCVSTGTVVAIEHLAGAYLDACEPDDTRGEEEVFAEFLGCLRQWFEAGVLLSGS